MSSGSLREGVASSASLTSKASVVCEGCARTTDARPGLWCSNQYKCKIASATTSCSNKYPCKMEYYTCKHCTHKFRQTNGATAESSSPVMGEHGNGGRWSPSLMAGDEFCSHISLLQEHLQKLAPSIGCQLDAFEMYRIEDSPPFAIAPPFRARVVLENTARAYKGPLEMEWSTPFTTKKAAQHAAARLALDALKKSGARPHDPSQVPTIAVREAHRSQGNGVGDALVGGRGGRRALAATLPKLSAALLSVDHVLCYARQAGAITADPSQRDSLDVILNIDALGGARDEEHGSVRAAEEELTDRALGSEIPPNLGALGEECVDPPPFVNNDSVPLCSIVFCFVILCYTMFCSRFQAAAFVSTPLFSNSDVIWTTFLFNMCTHLLC
jgi:hypothetical protein